MFLRILLLIVAMHAALLDFANAEEPRPITKAANVFAVYTEDWRLVSTATAVPKLVFCAWDDGLLAWSTDRTNGGAPYYTAQLKPDEVEATLKHIDESGAFDIPRLNQGTIPSGSRFTIILVRRHRKELRMVSSHEFFESGGKLVDTARGVESLNGRKLLQVLADQPADYIHFRMTWLHLKLVAASLVPTLGRETSDSVKMLQRDLLWQPSDD